jgi:phosphate transport system substrate-binding protein
MLSKKIIATVSVVAIITIFALVLGCTSPSATPTPTVTPTQTGASATPAALSGKILVAGSSSVGPHMDNLTAAFKQMYPGVTIDVSISDSGTGIKSTESGTCDIGMSSRALTATDGADLNGTIIAYDGIAIIVSKDNPVTNLTKQQIKDIFAGNITNWKDVGGKDASITVYQRESSSGTRSAFNSLVMGTTNVTTTALQASNTLNMIMSVKGNPNAIGYTSFGEMSTDVNALQVGGVTISQSTIKDKSYAIQRPFLFVTKGAPTNPITIAFIKFVTSSDGQAILSKDNLVSIL